MRLLLFADMHIGSIKDTTYYFNVVTDIIEKEVEFQHTDAVIILGDYFDRLFKANEEFISLAINVMSYLVRACKKNKTKIRIVYGTESHEMNQYKLFNHHFSSRYIDMKLFTTCTEEELFPNVNVLWVPEEYVDDKHEFYKNTLYSGKQYDYIFGHGNIVDGLPSGMVNVESASKNLEKQVPRFKAGELSEVSKLTVFGHIHKYTKMKGNVYYLGSLFRNSFGEEDPKGYGIVEDDKLTFVENTAAYIYKTYEFKEDSVIYQSNDKLVEAIDGIKEENPEVFGGSKEGKIRIIFHMNENIDQSIRDSIRDILGNDKSIAPMIKETNHKLIEEAMEEIDDEYEFVLDSSMKIHDKIYTFINKKYDTDLTLKEIIKYIDEPLSI